jgi:hypothetical protein
MKAIYCHKGESLDYVNGTDAKIGAGDVLTMGGRIGVAGRVRIGSCVGRVRVHEER